MQHRNKAKDEGLERSQFVMDCSVTMALLLVDSPKKDIQRIETLLLKSTALVPSIWRYEVGNVLCMAIRSKRISEAHALELKSILSALSIHVDDLSNLKALDTSMHLAHQYHLSVYDAAYLELAMREGVSLFSFDKQLKLAARKAGISLL